MVLGDLTCKTIREGILCYEQAVDHITGETSNSCLCCYFIHHFLHVYCSDFAPREHLFLRAERILAANQVQYPYESLPIFYYARCDQVSNSGCCVRPGFAPANFTSNTVVIGQGQG